MDETHRVKESVAIPIPGVKELDSVAVLLGPGITIR